MPNLIYPPPPGRDHLQDRILAHPERILAAWWGWTGALVAFAVLTGTTDVRLSLLNQPVLLASMLQLCASGALIVLTLFWRARHGEVSMQESLERVGWILGIGGWAAYGAALIAATPFSLVGWSLPVAMIALCVVRLVALRRVETTLRARLGAV